MRRKKRPNGKNLNLRLQGIEWKLNKILYILFTRQDIARRAATEKEKSLDELIAKMNKAAKELEEMAAN